MQPKILPLTCLTGPQVNKRWYWDYASSQKINQNVSWQTLVTEVSLQSYLTIQSSLALSNLPPSGVTLGLSSGQVMGDPQHLRADPVQVWQHVYLSNGCHFLLQTSNLEVQVTYQLLAVDRLLLLCIEICLSIIELNERNQQKMSKWKYSIPQRLNLQNVSSNKLNILTRSSCFSKSVFWAAALSAVALMTSCWMTERTHKRHKGLLTIWSSGLVAVMGPPQHDYHFSNLLHKLPFFCHSFISALGEWSVLLLSRFFLQFQFVLHSFLRIESAPVIFILLQQNSIDVNRVMRTCKAWGD